MKENALIIYSHSLGDILCVTPVLRKLYNTYGSQLVVVTHVPEIFYNNPYISEVHLFDKFSENELKLKFNILNVCHNLGYGQFNGNVDKIEQKGSLIDTKQLPAIDLGFTLLPEEMLCDFYPDENNIISTLPKEYICIHPVQSWPSRTWIKDNWLKLIDLLNVLNIPVVSVGKEFDEKLAFHIEHKNNIDLIDKLTISQTWHVINNAKLIITMDSFLLHLAGTTDTHIILLGSSINPKFRMPYRKNTQDYKISYIKGPCDLFCASDMKYSLKEWGSIQAVPLITGCLENKSTFECNPSPMQVINEIKSVLDITHISKQREEMKKIIIISPHFSTGGLPSYLLKQVEILKDTFDVYVVEYEDLTAGVFVVQKNKIISILEDEHFITLCKNKFELLNIIHNIHPDIIHFEEFPELFMDKVIVRSIYSKIDRYYTIVETTHNSAFNDTDKIFLPDKFSFVSNDSVNKFGKLGVPCELVEYPIEVKIKKDKSELFKILNLDPEYKHVLNVGLFTPGKNQKEIFNYARKLKDHKIKFHFVGNQAGNFRSYWEPIMQDKPDNCIVWGERNDVDLFYDACDLFLFTSTSELNPIVLKEAMSWKLPILMYNLPIYNDMYDNMRGVFYLTQDHEKNISIIKNKLGIFEKYKNQYNVKLVHLLTYPNEDIEKKSIEHISKLSDFGIEYIQHVNSVPTELTTLPAKYPTSQDGTVLLPGHYGCFHAFQRAIETEFTPNVDFFMICERDCVMTIPVQQFYENMIEILPIILKEDISYFSFGDTADLEFRVTQSIIKRKLEYTDLVFITNKIIGLQCILFPKSSRSFLIDMFKNVPWYAMDTWFNEVFLNEYLPMGIVTNRMTTQLSGYSLIENRNKEFK